MTDIATIDAEKGDLATHVQICAQRHEQIRKSIDKIERQLWALIGFLVVTQVDQIPGLVKTVLAAVLP